MAAESSPESAFVENLMTLTKAKAFLGREFLTWLWHQSESDVEMLSIETPDGQNFHVSVWIDDRVVLESAIGLGHTHAMRGGDPSRSPEAAAALVTGKTVKELKLGMMIDGIGEFTCVLDHEELAPRSLQLPKPDPDSEEPPPGLEARVIQIDAFVQALDGLFMLFLKTRTRDDYDQKELSEIRDWIRGRTDQVASQLVH